MITKAAAAEATTCTYGDAEEVRYLVETGRGVEGLCIEHAANYGHREHLVSVDDVEDETEELVWVPAGDGSEIELTWTQVHLITSRVAAARSMRRSGWNAEAARIMRELRTRVPHMSRSEMQRVAHWGQRNGTRGAAEVKALLGK